MAYAINGAGIALQVHSYRHNSCFVLSTRTECAGYWVRRHSENARRNKDGYLKRCLWSDSYIVLGSRIY